MKIKIIKKIEVIGYDIVKKLEVFEKEIGGWNDKEIMEVCGCNVEDGMGWKVEFDVNGVMIVGCVDGDVEFVVVKV